MRPPTLLMAVVLALMGSAASQSSLKVTGTFGGSWLGAVYSGTSCLAHPSVANLYICAVHDTGFTKMVGYTITDISSTPTRVDGRYVSGLLTLDAPSIGAAWDGVSAVKGITEPAFQITNLVVLIPSPPSPPPPPLPPPPPPLPPLFPGQSSPSPPPSPPWPPYDNVLNPWEVRDGR